MRSSLKNKVMYSPLAGQSHIKRSSKGGRRQLHASLLLTSLVDAFSILVIFLMMNSATDSAEIQIDREIQLPKAVSGGVSMKVTTVKIVDGKYRINDRPVDSDRIVEELIQLRKSMSGKDIPESDSLLIVADRDLDYQELNPILISGSKAGFHELRFAVVRE